MGTSSEPRDMDVVPDEGAKSAEYALAQQDAEAGDRGKPPAGDDHEAHERPDLRAAPGSPEVDEDGVRDAEAQLDRVITK